MSKPIARLTGKSEDNPTVIISTGNNLYLYFKTSLGDSRRGFSIRFTQGCKATIIARNGTVQSPSYGLNDYPNNQECLYKIKNPDRGPLSLKFTNFTVHKTDYVQVSLFMLYTQRSFVMSLRTFRLLIFPLSREIGRYTMVPIQTVYACIPEAVSPLALDLRSRSPRKAEKCSLDSSLMLCTATSAGRLSFLLVSHYFHI